MGIYDRIAGFWPAMPLSTCMARRSPRWGVPSESCCGTLRCRASRCRGGLSITRSGEVLVPLVDGRLACIGGGEAMPSAAEPAGGQQPGLILQTYDFSPYRPARPFHGVWCEWDNVTRIPAAGETGRLEAHRDDPAILQCVEPGLRSANGCAAVWIRGCPRNSGLPIPGQG